MNLPTLIVLVIVILAAAMAVYTMHQSKKSGKSCSCGGNCGGCPSTGMCHSKKES